MYIRVLIFSKRTSIKGKQKRIHQTFQYNWCMSLFTLEWEWRTHRHFSIYISDFIFIEISCPASVYRHKT